MTLTLIRHAEMTGDPFVRPSRPVSGCLTEERGIPQARATGDALAGRGFDYVLCSSYGRALQTAEIIFGDRGIPIRALDFLREWDPTDEVKALENDEFERRMAAVGALYPEETWKTEVGEGKLDMYARIIPPFLRELASIGIHGRHGGFVPDTGAERLSVAVVAHGGSLNVIMEFLMGRSLLPSGGFSFVHTGVAVVKLAPRQGVYYAALVIPSLHGLAEDPWD